MKVCIVGAGNTGIASAVDVSQNNDAQVVLFTAKKISLPLVKIDSDTDNISSSSNIIITDNLRAAVKDSDFIIVTYPSFMIEKFIRDVENFICSFQKIIFLPGYGGKEFFSKTLSDNGCRSAKRCFYGSSYKCVQRA